MATLYDQAVLMIRNSSPRPELACALVHSIEEEEEERCIVGLTGLCVSSPADAASSKLESSNVFTIARRSAEGQDILYQSIKLTNNICVLSELRLQPGSPVCTVRRRRRRRKNGEGEEERGDGGDVGGAGPVDTGFEGCLEYF